MNAQIKTQENTEQQVPALDIQPAYTFDIAGIEQFAHDGFNTYTGRRQLEFRAGIEIEFQMGTPDNYREQVTNSDKFEDARKNRLKAEILNQATLDKSDQDNSGTLSDFKTYATGFINRLQPQDEAEEKKKADWLEQIDTFKSADAINFLIYEQFSKPQLKVPALKPDANLAEVDAFADENGWIEWRFGNGSLQSGYYDNPGVSEIRLSPCSPQEALRRKAIILDRMAEIGEEFGVLIATSAQSEHINLSAYDTEDPESASIFGNDSHRTRDTIDVVTGVMAAHSDGFNLDPQTIRNYDYNFSKHHQSALSVGPTRKTLRVLDGRIELRGGFSGTEQGTALLLAGAVQGVQNGVEAFAEQGYETASVADVLKVIRADDFVKEEDLQIQRLFENSEVDEKGKFKVNDGFMMLKGNSVEADLFQGEMPKGMFSELIVAATNLDDTGTPQVTPESLREAWEAESDYIKNRFGQIDTTTIDEDVARLNNRLRKVTLVRTPAIIGRAEYKGAPREEIFERLRSSGVAALALGSASGLDGFISEIDTAANEYELSKSSKE